MAMGRGFRVYHNLQNVTPTQPYSLVLEQRGKNEVLLLENYAVVSLSTNEFEPLQKQYVKVVDAYGCLGILRVNAGENILHFLILVTGCNSVGKICNNDIYRVTNLSMLSLRGYQPDEEKVAEIKKLLCCGTFYFTWAANPEDRIDLSLSVQKAEKATETDNRFFWNRMLHIPFIRFGIATQDWLLKVTCGSVEIRTVYVGSRQAKAAVISRLSSDRAGTRFQVRGVDDEGHVANFAESEQVIYLGDEVTSFLQVRGSVPLFWEQPGVNVGSHKIRMARGPELSAPAFDRHMTQLKKDYGNQAIVNLLGSSLVGSKEGEATLSTAFQTHHRSNEKHSDIPHILFDYHAEVKSGSAKNLAKLKSKSQKYVEKFGFFSKKGSDVSREQFGTVRTNCTDCLDRTNCVQTYFGLEVLNYQLMDLGLTDKPNIVSRFEELFKQMWINNGNELSKMYAGTAALGAGSKIMDGARSAARTIQNNLLDSTKQEAIDVLLFGSSFNSDLADKARVLLPPNHINAPRPILETLIDKYDGFTSPVPIRVAVGTYNINGGKHFRSIVYKDVSLSDWLLDAHKQKEAHALVDLSPTDDDGKPIDIYAIGFEEMVDLDAKNIMNASTENAKAWASELTKILNREERFTLLTYQQLVGVCLYVFVRPEHAPYVRDVGVDCVKTGMGGATGNKGAVAIRLRFHSSSLCFVCSHFAAGQNSITDRNNDYNEAVKRILFPKGRTMSSHDYIFWCGDFNYRINMARDDVKDLVIKREWETLLSADQLKIEQAAGNVFNGFQEGDITFPPTYKYDLFSDDYDTSEKLRIPAWTDRVLWRRRSVKQPPPPDFSHGSVFWYGRAELKQSDHRPILCMLDVDVLQLDEAKREQVYEEALQNSVGPPDGSILIEFRNDANFDIQNVLDDHFLEELTSQLQQIGEIRFTKFIHEMIWVAFMNHKHALEAEQLGQLQVCGHDLTLRLYCPNWRELLNKELLLCSNNNVPLCPSRDLNLRRESKRLLSQLSQLSFEELEDMTMNEPTIGPPVKPPPPRPAPPPSRVPPARPAPPPSRPPPPSGDGSKPSRPAPPPSPSRPPPPKPAPPVQQSPLTLKRPIPPAERTGTGPPPPVPRANPSLPAQDSTGSDKAGFSDIFTVTSPIESDLPISSSSGSIVALAAAADGGSMTHSSSTNSLEYPEGYDPLIESGNAWINGTEQTIPGVPAPVRSDSKAETPPEMPPPPPPADMVRPALPPRTGSGEGSGHSTPSNAPGTPKHELPPKRGAPPPLPPGRPPPGPPPALPSRGPPPPLPRR